jgi:hypothetical protein
MWTRPTQSQVVVFAGLAAFGLGGLACTPLGGWLYSDPTFALTGVSMKFRGSPADTLQVILTGCNLNDFDLGGLTVEGQLLVNGVAVGVLSSTTAFTMKLRDSVDVPVPLRIPRADEPPVHAKGDDMIAAQYELNGRIELSTPIGIRRVVLRQLGDVRFDSAGVPSGWTVRNARPCKPGQSIIPGQSIVPRTLVDTMFRPQPPTIGQPGQVNPF